MPNFKKIIWAYYKDHRRSFPWREKITPYDVTISEIMLQQTQAPRVVPKFNSFIKKFPDFKTLAKAPLREVLLEWKGLGYNRRALQLKKLAEIVSKSTLPHTREALIELPGIGPNTAGSIMAFAYNIPQVFIETNIRTVFIHFFFTKSRSKVDDGSILKLVEKSLTEGSLLKNGKKKLQKEKQRISNAREWYYALMDYGVHLKSILPNPSRKSLHHIKQSSFKGSNREIRAKILHTIIERPKTLKEIEKIVGRIKINKIKKSTGNRKMNNVKTILQNLIDLEKEGFIIKKDQRYMV